MHQSVIVRQRRAAVRQRVDIRCQRAANNLIVVLVLLHHDDDVVVLRHRASRARHGQRFSAGCGGAEIPRASCSVTATLSEKLPAPAGVIARPFSAPAASCAAENVMLPFAMVSVLPLVLLRVAPAGMPPIVTDERLLLSPAKPLGTIPRFVPSPGPRCPRPARASPWVQAD